MRRATILLLVVGLAAVAAGSVGAKRSAHVVATACTKDSLQLVNSGQLTVGTDNPAYPPWFGGGTPKGSKWKINDPATGKGFESAVAYAVAKQLGFAKTEVQWTYVPFN